MSFEQSWPEFKMSSPTELVDGSLYATIDTRWQQYLNPDTDVGIALIPNSPHIESTVPKVAEISRKQNATHIGFNINIDIDLEGEIKRMFLGINSRATNIRIKQSKEDRSFVVEAYDMNGVVELSDTEKLDFIETITTRCTWRAIRKNEPEE